ncbi:amino acid transporter [Artomyces pyxidatus]|uniref:Amino acid transporter n=1 Tax=Artomyces pyxidatus TaxID=48021 RepID=A0ACB8SPV4_9AGAM|nr:amino acid transporter [Artomyces pyxidatus]
MSSTGSVKSDSVNEAASSMDQDELQMAQLGYKQQLHRTWHFLENFAASFVTLNFMASIRTIMFLGLLAGGPQAVWSTFLISVTFSVITAFVIAEVCSALPLSGSIYIWAAESAGPKYARFVGFMVACWAASSWITFTATSSQGSANYVVSQFAIWEIDFPGGISNDNILWRAMVWAMSEGFLILSVVMNYLPPKVYSGIFKFSIVLIFLDFLLCLIWLPIAAHSTYGLRSAKEVFTSTYNGTGATPGWNWVLSFLFSGSIFIGYDASGHVAEETKNAHVTAGRGIISSVAATGIFGFCTVILFLFCTPDLKTVFSLDAPQPFVQIYALALGKGPSIFMTIVAVVSNVMCTTVVIVAGSRLIFAIARDGVLPLSWWIGKVNKDGQPRNAVTVVFVFSALLLCTILPSQTAFTSLLSSGGVTTIASYGLIALLRFTVTPGAFKSSHFYLGRLAKPFYIVSVIWNGFVFAVLISPFYFPVDAQSFNFACVIFGFVTMFAVAAWWFTPADKWLRQEQIEQALQVAEGKLGTDVHAMSEDGGSDKKQE